MHPFPGRSLGTQLWIVRKISVLRQLCEAPEGPVPGNWGQTVFPLLAKPYS